MSWRSGALSAHRVGDPEDRGAGGFQNGSLPELEAEGDRIIRGGGEKMKGIFTAKYTEEPKTARTAATTSSRCRRATERDTA
jgi:hypothetical protein